MHIIQLDWTQLKSEIIANDFPINYRSIEQGYEVFVIDRQILWKSNITTEEEKNDFEINYKSLCNKPLVPYSEDGKEVVRAESRPMDYTTVFTCRGDSLSDIGKGKKIFWNFENSDDELEIESGLGIRKKRIEFKFNNYVNIKEGAIYFHNTIKGSFVDMYVVCPAGNYYLDNTGTPVLAEEDTIIKHYVNNHFIQGDCPMGDELNTESCSTSVPPNYKFWTEITVPQEDNLSNGYISLEIYRKFTITL